MRLQVGKLETLHQQLPEDRDSSHILLQADHAGSRLQALQQVGATACQRGPACVAQPLWRVWDCGASIARLSAVLVKL